MEETKGEKVAKSFGVTLHGPEGTGATFRVTALRKKSGSFTVSATYYDGSKTKEGKRQGKRGATSEHADPAAAQSAVEKVTAALVGKGWTQKARAGKTRQDAFDINTLPAPPRAKK